MNKKTILFILLLSSYATSNATIVSSTSFTHTSPGDLINMNATLAPGYGVPSDWHIYKKDLGDDAAKIYTQKSGENDLFILHKSSADVDAPITFRYTWSSGDPISSGTNVQDLGFGGYGNFAFDAKNLAPDEHGLIRLYISTGSKAETFSFESFGGTSEGSIEVGANEQGYIDIVYTNIQGYANFVRINASETDANAKIGFYAFAIAQPIPEPIAMGIITFVGLFVLTTKRIFNRISFA